MRIGGEPVGRRFQFGLRSLLVVTFLASVVFVRLSEVADRASVAMMSTKLELPVSTARLQLPRHEPGSGETVRQASLRQSHGEDGQPAKQGEQQLT